MLYPFLYLITKIKPTEAYGLPTGVLKDVAKNITTAGLAIIATLSMVMVIYGSILYITSAGKDENIEKGKKTIMWALLGVVFAVLSYSILSIITGSEIFK